MFDFAVLDLSPTPIERQRSLDDHQVTGLPSPDPDVQTVIVRIRPSRVIHRIVDAVDLFCLGLARAGGQREIGITTGLPEDREFVVDAAPPPLGMRVVQRPVPMDKTVAALS